MKIAELFDESLFDPSASRQIERHLFTVGIKKTDFFVEPCGKQNIFPAQTVVAAYFDIFGSYEHFIAVFKRNESISGETESCCKK